MPKDEEDEGVHASQWHGDLVLLTSNSAAGNFTDTTITVVSGADGPNGTTEESGVTEGTYAPPMQMPYGPFPWFHQGEEGARILPPPMRMPWGPLGPIPFTVNRRRRSLRKTQIKKKK